MIVLFIQVSWAVVADSWSLAPIMHTWDTIRYVLDSTCLVRGRKANGAIGQIPARKEAHDHAADDVYTNHTQMCTIDISLSPNVFDPLVLWLAWFSWQIPITEYSINRQKWSGTSVLTRQSSWTRRQWSPWRDDAKMNSDRRGISICTAGIKPNFLAVLGRPLLCSNPPLPPSTLRPAYEVLDDHETGIRKRK